MQISENHFFLVYCETRFQNRSIITRQNISASSVNSIGERFHTISWSQENDDFFTNFFFCVHFFSWKEPRICNFDRRWIEMLPNCCRYFGLVSLLALKTRRNDASPYAFRSEREYVAFQKVELHSARRVTGWRAMLRGLGEPCDHEISSKKKLRVLHALIICSSSWHTSGADRSRAWLLSPRMSLSIYLETSGSDRSGEHHVCRVHALFPRQHE